jgi:uncharacterized membrane protein YciS (DUF1049 family)
MTHRTATALFALLLIGTLTVLMLVAIGHGYGWWDVAALQRSLAEIELARLVWVPIVFVFGFVVAWRLRGRIYEERIREMEWKQQRLITRLNALERSPVAAIMKQQQPIGHLDFTQRR